jgi:hypothetical protein
MKAVGFAPFMTTKVFESSAADLNSLEAFRDASETLIIWSVSTSM